jgi:hypothetical protein
VNYLSDYKILADNQREVTQIVNNYLIFLELGNLNNSVTRPLILQTYTNIKGGGTFQNEHGITINWNNKKINNTICIGTLTFNDNKISVGTKKKHNLEKFHRFIYK